MVETESVAKRSLWALEAAVSKAVEPAVETPPDLVFFALLEVSVLLAWHKESAQSSARHVDGAKQPDADAVQKIGALEARVDAAMLPRRAESRFQRLVQRLSLTARETRLLEVLLVNHISNYPEVGELSLAYSRRGQSLSPYRIAGLTPLEALAFCKSERLHVKQSIVLIREARHTGAAAISDCVISPLAAKFAIHGDLSESEILKLEGTVIGDLLTAEQPSSGASNETGSTSISAKGLKPSLGKGLCKSGKDIFDFMAHHGSGNTIGKGLPLLPPTPQLGNALGIKGDLQFSGMMEATGLLDALMHKGRVTGKGKRKREDDDPDSKGLSNETVSLDRRQTAGTAPSSKNACLTRAGENPTILDDAPIVGCGEGIAQTTISSSSVSCPEQPKDTSHVLDDAPVVGQMEGNDLASDIVHGVGRDQSVEDSDDDSPLEAYHSDLSYLSDSFRLLECSMLLTMLKEKRRLGKDHLKDIKNNSDDFFMLMGKGGGSRTAKMDEQIRELHANAKLLQTRIAKRMELAQHPTPWKPRLQILAEALHLDQFEIDVILTLLGTILGRLSMPSMPKDGVDYLVPPSVGNPATAFGLLRALSSSLKEQVQNRRYFTKDSTLLREGIVTMTERDILGSISGEWSKMLVGLDRRVVDFVIGAETKLSEVVEGSHLYTPSCALDTVVLPSDVKDKITGAVGAFEEYQQLSKEHGLNDNTYGHGMVLLFYGPSGTGKTMMANALCAMLRKKLLLINFPTLGQMESDVVLKFIFREAKIAHAIVFFDECDSLFENRERGSRNVNLLLTEIERYNGLVFMATNRPQEMDEAMLRRITLAIEFRKPDATLREQLWKSLVPKKLFKQDDHEESWRTLAMDYELTGGLIKQAIACALSMAIAKKNSGDAAEVLLTTPLLREGARAQLKGRLRAKDLHRVRTPSKGLESLVLEADVMEKLRQIVHFEKARECLCGSWGFDQDWGHRKGIVACFSGPPGTGKTAAAEAVAFSIGKNLKLVNAAEVLSKWIGESGKNIDSLFEEARGEDAVLVFDEAEGLFGSREASDGGGSAGRHDTVNTGLLLYHLENFGGIVVLCTNLIDKIDSAFLRRFSFHMEFKIPPLELRRKLWRQLIPAAAPLAEDVDLDALARSYDIPGAMIKQSILNAATRAALRTDKRIITQKDLSSAAKAESAKASGNLPEAARLMFS